LDANIYEIKNNKLMVEKNLKKQKQLKDTFSTSYGTDFQTKVIQLLLHDDSFLMDYYGIIHPEYFDQRPHENIFRGVKRHYEKYRQVPTVEVLKANAVQIKDAILSHEIISVLNDIQTLPIRDLESIRDMAGAFCKNQKIANAVLRASEFLEVRDYDNVWNVVREAFTSSSIFRLVI